MRCKSGAVLGAAGVALVVALAGCSVLDEDDGAWEQGTIDWDACYDEDELDQEGLDRYEYEWRERLECGTVAVPLDHAEPDGEVIELAVARKAAEGSDRIGALVLNPGGPGESGVGMLEYPSFSDELRGRFDLVSFDPRGVGGSGGFECGDWAALSGAQDAVEGKHPADLAGAELAALEEAARGYARDCAEQVGEDFLAHLGTVNVVRDLDLLREALGEEELTYAGYSYGTYIGALYAEEYPERVRAMVLDGAVETERSNAELSVQQAAGFQTAWDAFVDDCVEWSDCPFTGSAAAGAEMAQILEAVDGGGYSIDGEDVTGSYLMSAIGQQLYSEESREGLREALDAIAGEDDAQYHLEALVEDAYGGYGIPRAADDGEYAYLDEDAVLTAVNCADRDDPADIGAYQEAAARAVQESPLFGADLVWAQLPCAYWPRTEPAPTGFTASGAPPIVVVGTLADPATPYAWARELSGQLEPAVLVTYEGAGHTVYGAGRSECVDDALDGYLIHGDVPEDGLSCPAVG